MQQLRIMSWLLGTLVVGGVLAAVGYAVLRAGSLPEGPVTPVWDKTACEFCRMHVGEPAFAAQLQTQGGEVWFYDDPGCLFEHLERDQPRVHAIWFHALRGEDWIGRDEVGFVATSPTPMGFGLGAVRAAEAGDALSFAQAAAKVRGGERR